MLFLYRYHLFFETSSFFMVKTHSQSLEMHFCLWKTVQVNLFYFWGHQKCSNRPKILSRGSSYIDAHWEKVWWQSDFFSSWIKCWIVVDLSNLIKMSVTSVSRNSFWVPSFAYDMEYVTYHQLDLNSGSWYKGMI